MPHNVVPSLPPLPNWVLDSSENSIFLFLVRKMTWLPLGKAIDLGCNYGRWCGRLAQSGFIAHGMDVKFAAVERARLRYTGAHFSVCSVDTLPYHNGIFAIATNVTVLQHVEPGMQEKACREIRRVLQDGGYWLSMEGRSNGDWVELMRENGFDICGMRRFHFHPFGRNTRRVFGKMESWTGRLGKIRVYTKIKNLLLNIAYTADIPFTRLLGRIFGTHIGIIAQVHKQS